jgi:hypothetical protein
MKPMIAECRSKFDSLRPSAEGAYIKSNRFRRDNRSNHKIRLSSASLKARGSAIVQILARRLRYQQYIAFILARASTDTRTNLEVDRRRFVGFILRPRAVPFTFSLRGEGG